MSRSWYVVHCRPREDARALEHLRRQSFHCYAPTLKVEKLRQSRRIAVQEPMFPRYVFVQLDEVNDNWHRIRSTRGVAQLVHCHERLLPIDDRIIEGIQARLTVDQPCVPYLKPEFDPNFTHYTSSFLSKRLSTARKISS